MKRQDNWIEYASARATPELVGRSEILDIIRTAFEGKGRYTQVIYITAKGGMGKTRLLEEVVDHWGGGPSRNKRVRNLRIVNHLIDLYHTHTHNEEGLITEIVERLDTEGKHFKRYAQKRAELNRKFEKGEMVEGARREMEDVFVEEVNELGKRDGKVVLVFDTAEVLTYETDRVQEALGLANQPIGVARWLTQDFIKKLRNAVVLIAGRPESPQLANELKKTGAKVTVYELPSFTEEETLDYFKVVAKAAKKENPSNAKRIASIPNEVRRLLHTLSQGEPFVLALLIDYLAIAKEFPSLDDNEVELFRERMRDLIVQAIQEGWRPMDEVVEALSWAPKGMGAELLAWVSRGDRQPTDEEVEEAQEKIQALRVPDKRLSFVKIRAADNLVFLQDEMYALMAKIHDGSSSILQRKKINATILNYYKWKIEQTRGKIEAMEKRQHEIGDAIDEKLTKAEALTLSPEGEKVRKARARLQAYQVEQVYYTLHVNLLEGYKLYAQYAEEAFQSRDLNLWLLLRDELLRFIAKNEQYVGTFKEDIEADMGTRWIKISLANSDYSQAEEQIIRFRATCPDLLKPGSYADLNLKIWETWLLIYSGQDMKQALQILNEILEKAQELPLQTDLDIWRVSFLKASAFYWQGYLYRSQGEFRQAVDKYLLARPIWRELKFELEAATNLNDLSWAEAEIGAFETALAHCRDGLHLRRKLGRQYLVGLSLNTLGLIETRAGMPEKAKFHCEQALEIFRRMEDARGIGLACLALAESLRRMTNADLLNYEQTVEHLQLATALAQESVMVFTKKIHEPLRQAEAYIELGCVYREWAKHLPGKGMDRKEKADKSRKAYEAAVTISEQWGYEYRAIDALVNLAWLYYYVGDTGKAVDMLADKVKERLGDEHLYTRNHGVDASYAAASWNWVQLGKANILLGLIYFDEYKEAAARKDKRQAEQKLRQAAHNWTLSMAYNKLYGQDFRDFAKGRDDAYSRLEGLNPEEMDWVRSSMEQTHQQYHVAEDHRAFEQLLIERFGFKSPN
jgi:hypothetical protein